MNPTTPITAAMRLEEKARTAFQQMQAQKEDKPRKLNLRPCPKCRAKDIRMGIFDGGYRMHCAGCGYRTPWPQPTFKEAVEQWNRECASVAPKLIPCPECGYPHLLIHHWEPRHEEEAESYQVECPECGYVALPANTEADAIEYWNRGDDGPALTEDPEEDVW